MPAGYQRIEPSPRYDDEASGHLGRAYAVPEEWRIRLLREPKPGPRTIEYLRRAGVDLMARDSGGLRGYQRAYQRSLYHCHNGGGNGRRNPVWSLRVRWGPELRGQGRQVAVMAVPVAKSAAYGKRYPAAERLTNPDHRSGGAGSDQQRFA
jgi:hypothetical protein